MLFVSLASAPASAAPQSLAATAPAPVPPGLESPRATMFTFLGAMGQTNSRSPAESEAAWDRAISTLDLSGLDDPAAGRTVAEQLLGVLDRLGEVTPDELPDAAEAAAAGVSRFRYFPRQPEHAWVWAELKPLHKAPEGQIVIESDGSGAWRFSARTVAEMAALYESVKDLPPRYVPRGDLVGLLGPTFGRTHAWAWLALLGSIFAGLVAGKLVQTILRRLGDRLAARGWAARASLFGGVASPISLALLTLGLTVGLGFLYFEPGLRAFADSILRFLYILALAWALYNFVDLVEVGLRQVTQRTASSLDDMVVPLIRKALRVFLVVVFTLVVAQFVFGLDITGWLAGLGIAGLAVSLAAQDSIKNLFGSLTVFFDQPFRVGDWIKFGGHDGTVEEIGFRSTRLRTAEGHLVTVPNMKFIDNSVENVAARTFFRRTLDVPIARDTPPEKVERAVRIVEGILAEPELASAFDPATPPRVAFDGYNADSLNLKVFYWYQLRDGRNYWNYLEHAQAFNLRLLGAFAAEGIAFAFPTQTLFLAGDPARALRVGSDRPAIGMFPGPR
jgi:MscS family membrane protein